MFITSKQIPQIDLEQENFVHDCVSRLTLFVETTDNGYLSNILNYKFLMISSGRVYYIFMKHRTTMNVYTENGKNRSVGFSVFLE